jgi:hypothetical protein
VLNDLGITGMRFNEVLGLYRIHIADQHVGLKAQGSGMRPSGIGSDDECSLRKLIAHVWRW